MVKFAILTANSDFTHHFFMRRIEPENVLRFQKTVQAKMVIELQYDTFGGIKGNVVR
jgi:hypothetical protein